MSERRDYLLRMIEQMGAMLARVRRLIAGGAGGGEVELLSAAQRAGVDLGVARALEPDSLVALLSAGGEVDLTRAWVTGELMFLDGLEAETRGSTGEALDAYRKALRLFLAIDPRVIGGIPESAERVSEIETRIAALTDATPAT